MFTLDLPKIEPLAIFKVADFFICSFGFFVLFGIWRVVQKNLLSKDRGYLWLSLAFGVWAFSFIIDWYCYPELPFPELKSGCSIINNGFFLYGIVFFDYRPDWIYRLKKPRWRYWVLGICLSTLLLFSFGVAADSPYALLPDLALSLITLGLLGQTFYNSFNKRGILGLAYISALVFTFIILAQVFIVLEGWVEGESIGLQLPNETQDALLLLYSAFFALISHSFIILLTLASALSWVKGYFQPGIPNERQLKIRFLPLENKQCAVRISVEPTFQNKLVELTPTEYICLLAFAVCKKCKNGGPDKNKYNYVAMNLSRITKKIQKMKPEYKEETTDSRHGEESTTEGEILGKWPNFFISRNGNHFLMHHPDNISIDEGVILSLANSPRFAKFSEIEYIKEVYGNCKNMSKGH